MKIKTEGISEVVLEVQSMERAVQFWSNQLGFPIVEQWGYDNGQFTQESNGIWATWLYVGGPTRLGLWLPRMFSKAEQKMKQLNISSWPNLYDEGGVHVHVALHVQKQNLEGTLILLKQEDIDVKIIKEANETRVYFKDTESNIIEFYTKSMADDYTKQVIKK